MQFIDLRSRLFQNLLAGCGYLVDPSPAASNILQLRSQQAGAFQTVEERVESAGTDAVPVVP